MQRLEFQEEVKKSVNAQYKFTLKDVEFSACTLSMLHKLFNSEDVEFPPRL
jgi:hypothetical protein